MSEELRASESGMPGVKIKAVTKVVRKKWELIICTKLNRCQLVKYLEQIPSDAKLEIIEFLKCGTVKLTFEQEATE